MKYEEVTGGGGNFVKWAKVGQEVEGIYRGSRAGQYGSLMDIEVQGELQTYPAKISLEKKLTQVEVGQQIKVVFLGLKPGKNGRTYNDFQVLKEKAAASKQRRKPLPQVSDDKQEEVPF